MNSTNFERLVRKIFLPFLAELGFSSGPVSVNGRFFRVDFVSTSHILQISFEPGDDELLVVVHPAGDITLSDFDNRRKSLRLSDLNTRYMAYTTSEERTECEKYFSPLVDECEAEQKFLKAARELYLVLPKFLNQSRNIESEK